MKLWIARNKIGWLCLYRTKPTFKDNNYGGYWIGNCMGFINTDLDINKRTFSEVTFENSPQEVELKLI